MKLHSTITYSFMVAGHSKFSPDRFFGLLKLKLRNSGVDNLEDLAQVVRNSTTNNYNIPQLVIENNQRKYYFYFSQDNIGHAIIKSSIDGAEQKINLIQYNQSLPTIDHSLY
ncbi:chaperonin: PROVISIONAL [Gigaspora margarita]|uniref:Chaperonin: PROVISIONAL n=1 Tax=Gigaspora margarita TaxID=4874 RepID=A0A8H3X7I0_GIGMA|nr:chaperonin: PROVISIONAL [Gigaspora margarita]